MPTSALLTLELSESPFAFLFALPVPAPIVLSCGGALSIVTALAGQESSRAKAGLWEVKRAPIERNTDAGYNSNTLKRE
jgi:hypothetical protein